MFKVRSIGNSVVSCGVVAIVLLLIALGLVVRHYNMANSKPKAVSISSSQASTSGRYWIMEAKALNDVAASSKALNALKNGTIFVPGFNSTTISSQTGSLHLIPTETFTSEAAISKAIDSRSIKSNVKAILYDNEDWSLTPEEEQANPIKYYQLASTLVQGAGYSFIGTPVSKIDPDIGEQIAPYVNVLDIQSQFDQAQSTDYAAHVSPIAIAARSNNPKLIILSGLSTNPSNGIPTLNELLNDARSVETVTKGYWLNIPSPGTACPNCHEPQPELAIQFLSALGPE